MNFNKLTKEQQDDVISRTFHSSIGSNSVSEMTEISDVSYSSSNGSAISNMSMPSDFSKKSSSQTQRQNIEV